MIKLLHREPSTTRITNISKVIDRDAKISIARTTVRLADGICENTDPQSVIRNGYRLRLKMVYNNYEPEHETGERTTTFDV